MTNSRRPPVRYQMTLAWKAAVVARLAELGWTKKDLADKIGVTKSAISQMLSDRQTSSLHVPKVCDVLKLPMPVLGGDDEVRDIVERLSPEDREVWIAMGRRLAK